MASTSSSSSVVHSRKPRRCLVIQLARLGDTLQSLMALRAAKQLYPELEIHFVARERFAAAAKRTPWIENVITLPTDALLGPVLTGERKTRQALGDVARWITPLIQEPWDLVINWSYSEASSYLTGLLPAYIKLGYSRRKDTSFSSLDGWSNYIQAVVQGSISQNIHLTDILTTQLLTALQIHLGDPKNEGDAPVTSKSFFSLQLGERELGEGWSDHSRKWLAIQLGAGREDKTWSPEKWAETANLILKRHPEYNFVLLGGKEDQDRAKQLLSLIDPAIDQNKRLLSLVGQTDFDLWASVVGRCQWLFSGDTAAIHLASVLGTRVLNVSVGPVRWSETGPYGNGHYVITAAKACSACQDSSVKAHTCRDSLTAQAVYGLWSYASSEWSHQCAISLSQHLKKLGMKDLGPSVEGFRSKIRSTDDGGGVHYQPLLDQPISLDEWLSMTMGHIARSWYCGWVPAIGLEIDRKRISPSLVKELRELDESSELLLKVLGEAQRTALLLNRKSAKLRSDKLMSVHNKSELQDLGKKIIDLDGLVDRLGKTHLPLKVFNQMSQVMMHNLEGAQLADLGKESADCYKQLAEGVSILRNWARFTLDLAKPRAIKPKQGLLELVESKL